MQFVTRCEFLPLIYISDSRKWYYNQFSVLSAAFSDANIYRFNIVMTQSLFYESITKLYYVIQNFNAKKEFHFP